MSGGSDRFYASALLSCKYTDIDNQLDYHSHIHLQEILVLELLDHFLLHLLGTVVGVIPD